MNRHDRLVVVGMMSALLGCEGPAGPAGPAGAPGSEGPPGVSGAPGAQGAAGERGAAGGQGSGGPNGGAAADGARVVSSIFCTGGLEGTLSLDFAYDAHVFANGNVFASGSIRDGAIEASATQIYAPTQNGATRASVLLQFDQAPPLNAGFWELSVDRGTAVTSIVYHDVDVAGGTVSWTMPPSACVLNQY